MTALVTWFWLRILYRLRPYLTSQQRHIQYSALVVLNVTREQRPLVAGALLNAFHPHGPYFVLNIVGEQGTAKSCAARIVRQLVDSNENPLRSPPKEERDLLAQAASNRCVALDNLSVSQLIWQAPMIALAAQAFLLTIAFDTDKCPFYRCLSGILATIIGLLSWQLFLRHTALEKRASIELETLKEQHFGQTVHACPPRKLCGLSCRSRPLWACGLFVISLAGLLPLVELIYRWVIAC